MDTLNFKLNKDRSVAIHHNSDWSGEAIIFVKDNFNDTVTEHILPGELLLAMGRNAYKDHFINKVISYFEQEF